MSNSVISGLSNDQLKQLAIKGLKAELKVLTGGSIKQKGVNSAEARKTGVKLTAERDSYEDGTEIIRLSTDEPRKDKDGNVIGKYRAFSAPVEEFVAAVALVDSGEADAAGYVRVSRTRGSSEYPRSIHLDLVSAAKEKLD